VAAAGAHAVAHVGHAAAADAHAAAADVRSVAHQIKAHQNELLTPGNARPAGTAPFKDGHIYRVSADGHAVPVSKVPAGATVYVNGLHSFCDGTGTAIFGAQAIEQHNGGQDVYVVYNGHRNPLSVFHQNPAHPDAATKTVEKILEQNHGRDNLVGYSQGGGEIVNAVQRFSADGGTDGRHGLHGVNIETWGSTARVGNVDAVVDQGAHVVNHVHPTVINHVLGVPIPTAIGDFWAPIAGGAHATIVDGKTHTNDPQTEAIAPNGDNVFHQYLGSNPQLGKPDK
jgi:hypothetical protein